MSINNDKFCPQPWKSVYFQINASSPCHCIRHFDHTSPIQYGESNKLRAMKQKFLNNEFPSECRPCEFRESVGLKSTRKESISSLKEIGGTYSSEHFNLDDEFKPVRLELRFSNLCNYKCRMCEPYSSSEIAKELIEHEGFSFKDFPNQSVLYTNQSHIDEFKQLAPNLKSIDLTGGEPFLIKEYYEYLDYLIENGYNKNIEIDTFTNCSVYNPIMIEKFHKFRSVRFVVSIDGVGKTAEYIRHGTKWETVRENALRFAKLPFNFYFNTAISQYTLLDMSNLAKFLMELYEANNNIKTKCYAVILPKLLNFINMPLHHRGRASDEIDKAVEILTPSNFDIIKKEILGMKKVLQETIPKDDKGYIEFTEKLDKRRNENFEDVFGISLRP